MKNEDEINKLENIIANFDDIEETPPDYSDVMPSQDEKEYNNFPNIKIRILSGLNSKDTFFNNSDLKIKKIDLAALKIPCLSNQKAQTKDSKIQISANQAMKIVAEEERKNDQEEIEKLAQVEENYKMAVKELHYLQENYYKLNTHLKHFINQYEYIVSNHNLNEKNKKIKLVEFINEFMTQFHPKLKAFCEIKVCMSYLDQIKEELLKFIKLRYEMFYKYIQEVKELKGNLPDLKTNEL